MGVSYTTVVQNQPQEVTLVQTVEVIQIPPVYIALVCVLCVAV